jgi:hypothetical protein
MPTADQVAKWADDFEESYPGGLADRLHWFHDRLGVGEDRLLRLIGVPPAEMKELGNGRGVDWEWVAEHYADGASRTEQMLHQAVAFFSYNWEELRDYIHQQVRVEHEIGQGAKHAPLRELTPTQQAADAPKAPSVMFAILCNSRGFRKGSLMAMTFDATLKDMGRESPQGFLATFDQPPTLPVKVLNVDLSTVTAAADLVLGLGDPLAEIIHLDFQSRADAWKHADALGYHALRFGHYRVPVHTIILLRPQAAHSSMTGRIRYAPRPGRGNMDFGYEVVPLWKRPAEELLTADLGVTPLAVLGSLPENLSLEDGLATVAQRLAERLVREAPPERVKKLLTDAYLLTGLRVRRDVAKGIFAGVRVMHDSDTYLAILEEGEEKATREHILVVGEERFGPADDAVRSRLANITDLERLKRMLRRAVKAANWQEILDTP